MTQATQATLDARGDFEFESAAEGVRAAGAARADIKLSIYEDLVAIERDWRAFEQHADCTVFQSYGWLSTWQRHIGARHGVAPVIVTGRDGDGKMLFLLPLAIESEGFARRLTWLGSELGDYNAPLLAPGFADRVNPARFMQAWHEIVQRLQGHQRLRYDLVHFNKMPEMVGAQRNPFLGFSVAVNPSGAYLTHLSDDWETFYTEKRSSATRRRDRTKRKRLAESGEVRLVTPERPDDVAGALGILMHQKSRQFAGMGVANMFARPGYPEFYRALASDPSTREMVHVSRLEVGTTPAAVNLGLTFRDCYYHVLASYDDGPLSKFGPGAAHLQDLMAYAIGRKCRVFDFTIGDERYKRDWCDTELKLFDHVGIATWRGGVVAAVLLGKRGIKRWIKQTPVLWDAFFRLRSLAGSVRGAR